jgi:hypothetical protein
MAKYKQALKSHEDIFYLMSKPMMLRRLEKGKIDSFQLEKQLKRFKEPYLFTFEFTDSHVNLTWTNHWCIDYPKEDEETVHLFYKFINQYTSIGYNINAVFEKIAGIRDPKFFLPKINEPTVRDKVIESSKIEWMKKLKDKGTDVSIVRWSYEEL